MGKLQVDLLYKQLEAELENFHRGERFFPSKKSWSAITSASG